MNQKLRVTVVSSLPPQRGITPYTVRLLEALAAHGEIDVSALGFSSLYPRFVYPGGSPEAADGADSAAMPVPANRCLTWYNPLTWLWAGLTVRGDIVHAQWWSWFLAPAYVVVLALARLRGKRVVVTVHNADPHECGRWKRWLNALVMRQAHEIIVHAPKNEQQLVAAGADASRVTVVPHGVLSVAAHAPPLTRADARRGLGIPPDAKVALCFGNIRPYKGIDVMMEAAADARPAVRELRVIIAGELWKGSADPAEAARRIGVQDLVTCRLGYVPEREVAALFAAADVVVLPYTHFDGQSGAGTLALSAGRAVIVTDVGGLPELVRDRRAVVPPNDPQALAVALVEVLRDDELRVKLEADGALVRDAMSWDGVAAATVEVYREMQAGGRRALAGGRPVPRHGDSEAA